ncbi:MAG: hypothetical protein V1834_04555 [Candidatus Micrarchaeota archaeon]
MNVKLVGIPEQIMEGAIKAGIAKTKTDALLLGLFELDHRYNLLELLEDEQDVKEAKAALARIRAGKEKLYSLEEFEKATGMK